MLRCLIELRCGEVARRAFQQMCGALHGGGIARLDGLTHLL
jgi:hypothetical protein